MLLISCRRCVCVCVCVCAFSLFPSQELAEREEMIGVQEAMLRERAQLERRKLHSRQHVSRELNNMSTKITSMNTTINSKEKLRGEMMVYQHIIQYVDTPNTTTIKYYLTDCLLLLLLLLCLLVESVDGRSLPHLEKELEELKAERCVHVHTALLSCVFAVLKLP